MIVYSAYYSLFGESRSGLIEAPYWCFEVAEVEDAVTIETFQIKKEDARQRELMREAGFYD